MSLHTRETLQAWLDDETNFSLKCPDRFKLGRNKFNFIGVRKAFVLSNGLKASIQQSATHYCSADSFEMWDCPASTLLEPYGGSDDNPYSYVPLDVVIDYLNELERRA